MKRIREMMKQNENKREVNMHKQQLKIIDMHEKLLDEGFKVSYTTVRNFVNREEKSKKKYSSVKSQQLVVKWSLIGEK